MKAISTKISFVPVLLMLLFATSVFADSITTIQLRNRSAEEIIPVIRPLLEPGMQLSGHGYKLFLRAPPATVAEVEALVDSIDLAAQTLMISVFQGRQSDLDRFNFSGSFRIDSGDFSGSISASQTQRSSSGGPLHQLRVNEGSEGFIAIGASSNLTSDSGVDFASGFYVLPRLNSDARVTLQINSSRSNLRSAGGTIETLQADTQITAAVGEWVSLGGVDQSTDSTRSDGIGQRTTQRNEQNSIWIRADIVR